MKIAQLPGPTYQLHAVLPLQLTRRRVATAAAYRRLCGWLALSLTRSSQTRALSFPHSLSPPMP